MRSRTTLVPVVLLIATVLTVAVAHDRPTAAPVAAEAPAGPVAREAGSSSGFVVDDPRNSGSFCFAESPADCHYTFAPPGGGAGPPRMLHEKLELAGSDRTGRYWQYRPIRPAASRPDLHLPRSWFIPKDARDQDGIWYQAAASGSTPVFFGRAAEHRMPPAAPRAL